MPGIELGQLRSKRIVKPRHRTPEKSTTVPNRCRTNGTDLPTRVISTCDTKDMYDR